jgi:3',5'-nucleoside bisphosphate phosphatase
MRKLFLTTVLAVAVGLAIGLPALAHEPSGIPETRVIAFPKLLDGRSVLAVDLHTHSVFSDGLVWPDVRVGEAKRDGLYAMAVSEHLEYQPKAADIPHPDRNRSYQLAAQAAVVKTNATGADARPLLVINGSEITKLTVQPGHINAVFITDANKLLGTNPLDQLKAANAQAAFVFWNHPYWTAQTPSGVATLTPMHKDFIKQGLLHGIEVANGADMSDEAFQIALDNKLTILTKSETPDGLKAALKAGDTVAIYNGNLAGRKENVEAVVRSTLRIEVDKPMDKTTVVPVSVINDSPIPYMIENMGPEGFYDEGQVFTVKPGSKFTLLVKNVTDASKLNLTLKLLNTYTAPREHLAVTLRDSTKAN